MKQATIRDVARLAQVSTGTISNYLNERKPIGDDTRERIERAISQLNFVPNSAVRIVLGGRAPVIAFLVPDTANPFFAEVARGIEDVAVSKGLVVVTCNTQGDAERELHYSRALSEMRVTAAIAVVTSASDATLSSLSASGARVVTLGEVHGAANIPSVMVDDEEGGHLAMQHLLAGGHTSVVFFGGPGGAVQIADRLAGCYRALHDAGLPRSAMRRVDAHGSSSASRISAADELLEVSSGATGVVCANDLLAIALETAAMRRGLRIPDDLAIIGYDDIEAAASAPVPLSTVRQPQYELGRAAAELALAANSDEHLRFTPELVGRSSTRSV